MITLITSQYRAKVGNSVVDLNATEFGLLTLLADGAVRMKPEIASALSISETTITPLICLFRRRIGNEIVSVRGTGGYRLKEPAKIV